MCGMRVVRAFYYFSLLCCYCCFSNVALAKMALADQQVLNMNFIEEVTTVDPQKNEGLEDGHLARQIFEGLVNVDEQDNLVPGVATHWEHSADFKQWTFYLRKNAKWSNGDPVTAHDFVYAWRRLLDPKTEAPYANYLGFMQLVNTQAILAKQLPVERLGVQALDDYRLQLNLSTPVPFLAELTQHPVLFPVHRKTVEQYGDKWTAPEHIVSNGAYVLADRVFNEKIVLRRNKYYWNDSHTVINQANIFILDSEAAFNAYRSGRLHFSDFPSTFFKNSQLRQRYQAEILVKLSQATFFYEFNTHCPPFDDVRVRKALSLALDRKIMVENILGYGQMEAFRFVPPFITGGARGGGG